MSAGERARLFVALELPQVIRAALVKWRAAAVGDLNGAREVPTESLHVTLCFLGWRETREIDQIATACISACADEPPLALELGTAVWLPKRRPRVLAVRVEDHTGRLEALQGALSRRLSADGFHQPENRPFLGHVTVARRGRAARLGSRELPAVPSAEFQGTVVTLFRSWLGAEGSRYEALRRVELLGPAPGTALGRK